VNAHPDLTFAIGHMSHFVEVLWEDHIAAVKQILHYVVGISSQGLYFSGKKENQALLTRFSDADFAGHYRKQTNVCWPKTDEYLFMA
jgi:hypothetical protein